MTDREAVLKTNEYAKSLAGTEEYLFLSQTANLAIKYLNVLQEREKRSKGCEVCDPNPKAVWYRFKDKNVLCSFCPVCGRPLKGNADG